MPDQDVLDLVAREKARRAAASAAAPSESSLMVTDIAPPPGWNMPSGSAPKPAPDIAALVAKEKARQFDPAKVTSLGAPMTDENVISRRTRDYLRQRDYASAVGAPLPTPPMEFHPTPTTDQSGFAENLIPGVGQFFGNAAVGALHGVIDPLDELSQRVLDPFLHPEEINRAYAAMTPEQRAERNKSRGVAGSADFLLSRLGRAGMAALPSVGPMMAVSGEAGRQVADAGTSGGAPSAAYVTERLANAPWELLHKVGQGVTSLTGSEAAGIGAELLAMHGAGKLGARAEPPVADLVARLRASRVPLATPGAAVPTEAAPGPGYANLPGLEAARYVPRVPGPTEGVRAEPPAPGGALPEPSTALARPSARAGQYYGPGVIVRQALPGGAGTPSLPEGAPAPSGLPATPAPRPLPEQAGPTNYPGVIFSTETQTHQAGGNAPRLEQQPVSKAEPTAGTAAEPGVAPPRPAPQPTRRTMPVRQEGGVPTVRFGGMGVATATRPEAGPRYGRGGGPAESFAAQIELVPPPAEGTVPTARERAIEAQGGPRAVAEATGREIVEQKDGTVAIVPPERAAEAQALADQGKLAEIVNGEGTSPKPAVPNEIVIGRDAKGVEVRSVLTETPEQRASAEKALADAGLTVETKPASAENLNAVLEQRGTETPPAAPAPRPQETPAAPEATVPAEPSAPPAGGAGPSGAAVPAKGVSPKATPVLEREGAAAPEAPRYGGKTPARQRASGEPGSEGTWPVADMVIDADTMQFKESINKQGETGILSHIEKPQDWAVPSEGVVTVWRDPATGEVKVVDGHQRVNAAKRAGVQDLLVRFSKAKTADEAYLEGALINMRAGSVSPSDAARFFRAVAAKGENVREFMAKNGVSGKGPAIRKGQALANLSDPLWDQYRRGMLDEDKAIAIGKLDGLTPTQQETIANADIAASEVPAYSERVRRAAVTTETQHGLFGAETIQKSLDVPAARIETKLLSMIRSDAALFNKVARESGRIERVGHVEKTEAAKIGGESDVLSGVLEKLLGRAGPVNDAVLEVARAVDAGEMNVNDAAAAVRPKVVEILRREHPELAAMLPATTDVPAPAEPTLFGGPAQNRAAAGDVTLPETPPTESPPEGGKRPPRFGRRGERGSMLTPTPEDWAGIPAKLAQATQEAMAKVKRQLTEKSLTENLRDAWHGTQDFMRAEAPIERLERSRGEGVSPTGPTAAAFYGQGATGKQAETLWREGSADFGRRITQPIEPLLDDVFKHNEGWKLSAFLISKRVDTRYTPHGLDSGWDPRWASEFRQFAETSPDFARVRAAAEALNRGFQELLDQFYVEGGLTKAQWEAIKRDNGEFYVPIERVVGQEPSATGTGGAGPMAPKGLHKITAPPLKGGTQIRFEGVPKQGTTIETEMPPAYDPLIRSFEHMRQAFSRNNQARTARKLAEWYDADPKQAESVGMHELPPFAKGSGKTFDEFYADTMAKDPTTPVVEILSEWQKAQPADVLQTVVGGKLRNFAFDDPALGRAVMSLRPDVALPFVKLLGPVTAAKRILMTGMNLGFQLVVQPWRDVPMYLTKPRGSFLQTGRSLVNLPRGYLDGIYQGLRLGLPGGEYLPETKLSQFYERLPVEGFYDADLSRGPRGLETSSFKHLVGMARPLNRVLHMLSGMESGLRKAEVLNEAARLGKKITDPVTPDEIMQIANEGAKVTTPFKAGSSRAKAVARTQAFYNASLQGVRQLGEWVVDHPVETAARLAAISVLPQVVLWAKNHKEDWYKSIPAKLRYSTTYINEDVRLPTRGLLDLPGKLTQLALDRFAAQKPEDAGSLASDIMGAVGAEAASLVPLPYSDVAKPIVEVATGHSFFTGKPINPRGFENMEKVTPESVARSTDPKAVQWLMHEYRKIAEAVGFKSELTTAEASHFLRQYVGQLGMEGVALFDEPAGTPEPRDTPVFGRFAPILRTSAYISRFYDLASQMEGSQRAAGIAKTKGDALAQVAFELPRSARARLERIKERMRTLMTQYDTAPSVDAKKALARLMDAEAKDGIALMEPVLGTSKAVQEAVGK